MATTPTRLSDHPIHLGLGATSEIEPEFTGNAGGYAVNDPGVWHTADVSVRASALSSPLERAPNIDPVDGQTVVARCCPAHVSSAALRRPSVASIPFTMLLDRRITVSYTNFLVPSGGGNENDSVTTVEPP